MGKISKEHIDIIKDYLLSFDEGVRSNIRSTISTTLLKYITIIESGFIKDDNIDKFSREIGAEESIEDLLKIRNEYFITLAQISIDNKKNKALDEIKFWNNQSFQKLLNEMADDKFFEKDMSLAIKLHHREEMKKRFQQIDVEDEFEVSDKEIKAAITQVERESIKKRFEQLDKDEETDKSFNQGTKYALTAAVDITEEEVKDEETNKIFKLITKYAIAAALTGLLIGGLYLNFFKNVEMADDPIIANIEIPDIEIPNLIETKESKKSIIVEENSGRGFAKNRSNYGSYTIQQNGLSKQIDTLQAMLENLLIKDYKKADSIQYKILVQIDSLQILLNTYTFNLPTKKAVLNLPNVSVIENIISIDINDSSKFYIKIKGKYYLIETNSKPANLVPLKDKTLIEKLQRIEFLND